MKKYFIIFSLIFLCVLLSFFSYLKLPKSIPNKTKKSSVLYIAGDNNFPPYEFIDENGLYTGFNVDIIRAISLATGFDVKFHPMIWSDACDALKTGKIDVIQGMKYTKERDEYFDFSSSYLENSQSLFILSENNTIDSLKNLNNKKVAIQNGDIAINNLKKLPNVDILYTKSQEEAIKKLINKEVDAYIGNTLTGVFIINKMNLQSKIKIVGNTLNPTKYSMAVKNGDKEILELLNKGLKEIKKNGTYEKIYRKWFGQPVNFPTWYIEKIFFIFTIIIIFVTLLIFILYRFNRILKLEVQKQTASINQKNIELIEKNNQVQLERDFREQILNNLFNGVIVLNESGTVTFSNKLALEILNVDIGMILNKNYKDTILINFFEFEKIQTDIITKPIFIGNEKKYITYKINKFFDTSNSYKIILVFRDVTEEKFMQESIQTKDRLQSLGNLISGIAHEIRNPLTSIKTYTELIPKKYDNPNFREMISKDIPLEIERLNNLINDLLEFSRPRKPYIEKINIYNAVSSALALVNNKIKQENINIINYINPELYVFIDKNHFRQILLNIIINAIESMDKDNKKISFVSECDSDIISLSIIDNGCGIEEDNLLNVFNPFYTTKANGTGLGLFVCFQLLSENKASIKINSKVGLGTTFKIEFNNREDDIIGKVVGC